MTSKNVLLTLGLTVIVGFTNAQMLPTFQKGDHLLSSSYGVPNVVGRTLYYFQNDKFQSFGPVYFRYEYGLTKTVGLGFQASFSNFSFTYNNSNTGAREVDRGSAKDFHLFGTYHFGELMPVENLDLYGYLGMGMWYVNLKSVARPTTAIDDGVFHIAIKGGARYYFTPNIAGFAQVGFDKMSVLDFGLTLRVPSGH